MLRTPPRLIGLLSTLLGLSLALAASLALGPKAYGAPALSKDYPLYSLARDLRRCAAPACGGWWVSPVNVSSQGLLTESLLAADAPLAKAAPEYVARLDFACAGWTPEQISRFSHLADDRAVLVAGRLLEPSPANTNAALYQYGALQVRDGFVAAGGSAGIGPLYSVAATGIVCAVAPCPSYQGQLINANFSQDLHALEFGQAFSPAQSQQAQQQIATGSLVVSGVQQPISGPAGKGVSLNIQQIFWPFPAVQPE